ncbi:hypothetical protein LCGC14_2919240 [marine sediment metagenome]|uniref:Uncharacterized protein n=1 Tax=marine sediment metagenome TaxID=412755 RepID=A0A0F9AFD6_9ZZZZ
MKKKIVHLSRSKGSHLLACGLDRRPLHVYFVYAVIDIWSSVTCGCCKRTSRYKELKRRCERKKM